MTLCAPWVSDEVISVAAPDAFNVLVPIAVLPSKNVTEPVGLPVPLCGVTVAVKVTD